MGAAAVVVDAASCCFKRTTTPGKTTTAILVDTAASWALRAGIIIITNFWGLRRGRGRARIGWVWPRLYGVWCLNCNTTFAGSILNISFHPYEAQLSPVCAPWVLYNPIVPAIFSAIPYDGDTMIQVGATVSSIYSLNAKMKQFNQISSLIIKFYVIISWY